MISALLNNEPVKLIEDIRRARLNMLIDEYGSIAALANKLDRQPAQVSQWKNASIDKATGKPRAMKSDTARRIEERTGKPNGWMDLPLESNVLGVRSKILDYDSGEIGRLSDDEITLIRWFRTKSPSDRRHFLDLFGIAAQIDFTKSA
jgi:hypothetical protein